MTIGVQTRDPSALARLAKRPRIHALGMTSRGGSSHIGAVFSMADIVSVLYGGVLHLRPCVAYAPGSRSLRPEQRSRRRRSVRGARGARVYTCRTVVDALSRRIQAQRPRIAQRNSRRGALYRLARARTLRRSRDGASREARLKAPPRLLLDERRRNATKDPFGRPRCLQRITVSLSSSPSSTTIKFSHSLRWLIPSALNPSPISGGRLAGTWQKSMATTTPQFSPLSNSRRKTLRAF